MSDQPAERGGSLGKARVSSCRMRWDRKIGIRLTTGKRNPRDGVGQELGTGHDNSRDGARGRDRLGIGSPAKTGGRVSPATVRPLPAAQVEVPTSRVLSRDICRLNRLS